MVSLVNYIAEKYITESKALYQNVNIAESKALHQNVNIAEKLIVNKNYNIRKSPDTVDDLKNDGWKKVNLNDVDPKYFDVAISKKSVQEDYITKMALHHNGFYGG